MLPRLPDFGWRHPDEVVMEIGRAVAGWAVRLAATVLVLAMLALTWIPQHGWSISGVVVLGLLGLFVGLTAHRALLAALVLLVGGVVLLQDPLGYVPLALLILVVHLAAWGVALASRVTWSARVEWAVVADGLRNAALPQAVAQVLGIVALTLTGADLGDAWRLVALVAVGVVAALVLTRGGREND